MAQPILAIDMYNANPQVYRLNFADPAGVGAKIGGPIPTAPAWTNALESKRNYHTNYVIRHGLKIYAYQNLRIWVFDESNPTSDWQLLYQFPEGFWMGSQAFAGLHKMVLDDDPHLVAIGGAATPQIEIQHFSWNLRTNTLRADGVVVAGGTLNNQGFHGVTVWKQFLIWIDSAHNSDQPHKFDFINNSHSRINTDVGIDASFDSCAFSSWNGELYLLHAADANNEVGLWKYNENLDIFNHVHSTGFDRSQTGIQEIRSALWQQSGFLYAIAPQTNGGGGNGFKMWKFTQGTIISQQDLTTSLPANLRMPDAGSTEPAAWNDLQRWTAVIDQEVSPGMPQVTLYLSENGNAIQSTLTAYSWADPVMTPVDNGQAGNFTIAQELDGGGDKFWTAADVVPEVTKVQVTGTTVRVTFKLHGGGVQSLGIWWEFNQDVPTTRGTLTNPSAGTITGGGNDVLSGITADGVTQYSVEWRAQFDGVTDLDDVNFMIKPD